MVLPLVAVLALSPVLAAEKGTLKRVKVHGKSLEGNLAGDSPDRDVSIYLPPSYERDASRRFPVLYMLHGFTDTDAQWMGVVDHWINLPAVVDKALAGGQSKEMIVVMPNGFTRFHGSMYSSGPNTGDWETFIAEELVAYVEANYRVIPERRARGLAGHSMGGYGAMRIGMKNPDVFAAVYLLSPCCLEPISGRGPAGRDGDAPEGPSPAESIRTDEQYAAAPFMVKAQIAGAAAWAPNPAKPPFYLDLPVENGKPRPEILAKLTANAPLAMLDQYIYAIRKLEGLAMDAGDRDQRIAASVERLHATLEAYDVSHEFAIYEGDHLNRIAERIEQRVLPFFSERLTFE